MPPSPPPPPQPLIQVDPDSASLDHLLQVLDAARASAAEQPSPSSPAPPTRRRRRLDDSPPLVSHLDDLAADTLAQRHAARRQRELEWDERDNLDRARRALLSSLTARDGVRLSSSDGDPEPDLDHLSAAERFFHIATDLVQASADDVAALEGGDSDDDHMTDDDDDGWADAGPIVGFDGFDGFDGDMFDAPDDADWGGDDDDDDAHLGEVWAQPRPAAPSADFRSMLPGFAGERPLNPPHVAPSDIYSAPSPSPDPVIPYLSRDPSSALSYSSFLQPGATFVGEQTFGVRSRARAQHGPSMSLDGAPEPTWADPADIALAVRQAREAALRRSGAPPSIVSTAHPEFAPLPTSAGGEARSGAASSSSAALRNAPPPWRAAAAAWNDGPAGAASSRTDGAGAAPASAGAQPRSAASTSGGPRAETNPLLAILRGHTSPSSRYAPYSSSSSSTSMHAPLATHPAGAGAAGSPSSTSPSPALAPEPGAAPLSLNAAARARARVAQSVNPAARTSRSSWGEVGEELLLRAVAREREREAERERGVGKGHEGPEGESWSVKVTVLTYDPELKSITGLMRAHGVAIPPATAASSSSSAAVSDVTTFFSGSILHPILDGLFCSPSPTGSGGEFHITRASEAESWIQLGPFKGLTKRELLEGAKNRAWVEERTRGWVLFRWKERDFVNVTAKESSLSISGFYHVVLDRQTGEIEGLYHDPAATPNQRLVLSPADNERGAFSLGSFAYR
ncbi:hypothetical protein JCM9279_004209 [Rhodotorula babjevae]